jgi:hypothetical protein
MDRQTDSQTDGHRHNMYTSRLMMGEYYFFFLSQSWGGGVIAKNTLSHIRTSKNPLHA